MKKAIIAAVSVLLVSIGLFAEEPVRDYKAYKEIRAEAKAAESAGDYMKAYKLYLRLLKLQLLSG